MEVVNFDGTAQLDFFHSDKDYYAYLLKLTTTPYWSSLKKKKGTLSFQGYKPDWITVNEKTGLAEKTTEKEIVVVEKKNKQPFVERKSGKISIYEKAADFRSKLRRNRSYGGSSISASSTARASTSASACTTSASASTSAGSGYDFSKFPTSVESLVIDFTSQIEEDIFFDGVIKFEEGQPRYISKQAYPRTYKHYSTPGHSSRNLLCGYACQEAFAEAAGIEDNYFFNPSLLPAIPLIEMNVFDVLSDVAKEGILEADEQFQSLLSDLQDNARLAGDEQKPPMDIIHAPGRNFQFPRLFNEDLAAMFYADLRKAYLGADLTPEKATLTLAFLHALLSSETFGFVYWTIMMGFRITKVKADNSYFDFKDGRNDEVMDMLGFKITKVKVDDSPFVFKDGQNKEVMHFSVVARCTFCMSLCQIANGKIAYKEVNYDPNNIRPLVSAQAHLGCRCKMTNMLALLANRKVGNNDIHCPSRFYLYSAINIDDAQSLCLFDQEEAFKLRTDFRSNELDLITEKSDEKFAWLIRNSLKLHKAEHREFCGLNKTSGRINFMNRWSNKYNGLCDPDCEKPIILLPHARTITSELRCPTHIMMSVASFVANPALLLNAEKDKEEMSRPVRYQTFLHQYFTKSEREEHRLTMFFLAVIFKELFNNALQINSFTGYARTNVITSAREADLKDHRVGICYKYTEQRLFTNQVNDFWSFDPMRPVYVVKYGDVATILADCYVFVPNLKDIMEDALFVKDNDEAKSILGSTYLVEKVKEQIIHKMQQQVDQLAESNAAAKARYLKSRLRAVESRLQVVDQMITDIDLNINEEKENDDNNTVSEDKDQAMDINGPAYNLRSDAVSAHDGNGPAYNLRSKAE